jgi:hypothetical protein
MTSLASQQAMLLRSLFDRPTALAMKNVADGAMNSWPRGLNAYQSNGHVLAERSLKAAYPVVCQLLGEDSFSALAQVLWHAHPPMRGDLAQWGDCLSDFIAGSAQLADEPYLADVARAEWALHTSATQPDLELDYESLNLLVSDDPAHVGVVLAPGCRVFQSRWPVASILTAHLDGEPALESVGEWLRQGVSQGVVVWRHGMLPKVRVAMEGEVDFLERLMAGDSLSDALNSATALNFSVWFPQAVQTALVIAVQRLSAAQKDNEDGLSL